MRSKCLARWLVSKIFWDGLFSSLGSVLWFGSVFLMRVVLWMRGCVVLVEPADMVFRGEKSFSRIQLDGGCV